MNFSEKSVVIDGNLKEGPLIYTCYPNTEFSEVKWLLAINSVVFDSTTTVSSTCMITCNFVTSKKRNNRGDVIVYEQPLNLFHIKTSPTAPRGIFRFCNY